MHARGMYTELILYSSPIGQDCISSTAQGRDVKTYLLLIGVIISSQIRIIHYLMDQSDYMQDSTRLHWDLQWQIQCRAQSLSGSRSGCGLE